MSAQPDTDRSLNADKPATEPGCRDDTRTVADANARAARSKPGRNQRRAGPFQPDPRTARGPGQDPDAETSPRPTPSRNTSASNGQDLKLRDEALGVEALTVDEQQARGQAGPGREGTLPERDETPRGARLLRQAPRHDRPADPDRAELRPESPGRLRSRLPRRQGLPRRAQRGGDSARRIRWPTDRSPISTRS